MAALVCLFLTGVSHATSTLFSTLGQTVNGYGTITNDDSDLHQNQSEATDFRTGAGASTITGAWFGLINGSPTDSKTFLASIYSDNGGTVGTLVGDFDPFIVPANFNSPAPFGQVAGAAVHATTSGINLAANTNYWVYLHTDEGNVDALGWLSAQPGNLLDAGSVFSQVSATEAKVSVDFGATFLNAGNFDTPLYSLEGTQAVPEPSRTVLLMLGLGGVITQRHRRRAGSVDSAQI